MSKPPAVIDLEWTEQLRFTVRTGRTAFVLDSAGLAGPSPVDALAAALGGCMAMDLAHILTRGRHPFTGIRARLVASRSADDPHRLLSVQLHYTVTGKAPREAVDRAIALSREKYCSVWHSLRQDIALQVTCDLAP